MSAVRPPAVAGSFYPAEPAACAPRSRAISTQRIGAQRRTHAQGGDRAARRLRLLRAGRRTCVRRRSAIGASAIRRAVVIGPAHFVPFRGIAVPSAAAFRTPLGDVPLDRRGDRGDPRSAAGARGGRAARARACARGRAAVSPGRARRLRARAAPGRRGDRRRGRASAGAPVGRAGHSDRDQLRSVALRAVRARAGARCGDRGGDRAPRLRRASGRAMPAAGCRSAGLLVAAGRRGMRVARLDLRNSGDTAGPKDQVVGYGAWAFYET